MPDGGRVRDPFKYLLLCAGRWRAARIAAGTAGIRAARIEWTPGQAPPISAGAPLLVPVKRLTAG
jgi:hypothetical protein